jgi:hypothetical protein
VFSALPLKWRDFQQNRCRSARGEEGIFWNDSPCEALSFVRPRGLRRNDLTQRICTIKSGVGQSGFRERWIISDKRKFLIKLTIYNMWTFSQKKAILQTLDKSGGKSTQQHNPHLLE